MAKKKSARTSTKKQDSGLDKGNKGGGGGALRGDEEGKGMGTDFGVGYKDGEFSRDPNDGQNNEEEERVTERNATGKRNTRNALESSTDRE
jgi:hypothetical protein